MAETETAAVTETETEAAPSPSIAVHADGRASREALVADVRTGLAASPKWLRPRWFYDETGSELFERITELPEYYQTRTEIGILKAGAGEIARSARPESLVELGAGSCLKSRILIDACREVGTLAAFVPFDISEAALRSAAAEIRALYPDLAVEGIVGDLASHLDRIPRRGRQLVAFLGGTIGNFDDGERQTFLGAVRRLLEPDDAFLLGLDLVKPVPEMMAAYDDAQGVTAAFNLNLLRVLNRELDADFDPAAFEHRVSFDHATSRMEMRLRSLRDQEVHIPAAAMRIHFEEGEEIRTEISAKFSLSMVEAALAGSQLRVGRWFLDSEARFAVVLALPSEPEARSQLEPEPQVPQ